MESVNEKVKSNAVVKYSAPCPAKFTKLQCNTDLNLPPSNWLSSSVDSYGLKHVLYGQQGFSSFRMAHMFPDCVGEVDVVSDSENIKNLLKIPYHKGSVSMIVHRVENTLLLDNFDIYRHILRTAETEWEWLRKVFLEHFKHTVDKEESCDSNVYFKSKSRKALKLKNLTSKFLYHSLAETDTTPSLQWDDTDEKRLPIKEPTLPEPSPAENVPDPESNVHKYNRNVVWTFEDIRMLIGTDMPIFGGGVHPCVSLRLRDMTKPINVLTGIDYWLDNLMSNVPEVVMCYHLNGIVQRYELIKTEDLPRLDNSRFSPKVIREVAKSILSFLKSNATKSGHTYWLFKPKDEDVVKLYDLTSLCSKYTVNEENPFTVPVAMLLYRVARNMRHSKDRPQPSTIRMLLRNCVELLDETKYPEIVTSSHYMLSDVYVPENTNPESPKFEAESTEDSDFLYEDDLGDTDEDASTKILILDSDNVYNQFTKEHRRPLPITESVEERCSQAIHHVAAGLNCLKHFRTEKKGGEEEEMNTSRPSEPIPMPYEKIHKDLAVDNIDADTSKGRRKHKKREKGRRKSETVTCIQKTESFPNALLLKNNVEAQRLPTWDENQDSISWKDHLKILMYKKAVLVYATLSEQYYIGCSYGNSLRNLGLLVRCHQILQKLFPSANTVMESCLLGRAGDCCIMIVQNWSEVDPYRSQFDASSPEDDKIVYQLEKDEQQLGINHSESNMRNVLIYDIRTIEQMLLKGVELYDEALKYGETDSILLRLGNALNEIGSFYLNRARGSLGDSSIFDACAKAESCLKRALDIFERIKNDGNAALLYTNIGHLHRLLAHANSPAERGEITNMEKVHYKKAFVNYKKALQVLGERHNSPGIWDVVKWELSTALFTMATILVEHPDPALSRAEAEKEASEVLLQALKYCDLDENNPKFPLYQFRAALIHYRLGSLYHSNIWNGDKDSAANRKNIIHLAKIEYERAAPLFLASNEAVYYFTSLMQCLALCEYLGESSSTPQVRIGHYEDCVSVVTELRPMLELFLAKKVDFDNISSGAEDELPSQKYSSLLNLSQTRLQSVLLALTKLCLAKTSSSRERSRGDVYKSCYALSLKLNEVGDSAEDLSRALLELISQIEEKRRELQKSS